MRADRHEDRHEYGVSYTPTGFVAACVCGWTGEPSILRDVADRRGYAHLNAQTSTEQARP